MADEFNQNGYGANNSSSQESNAYNGYQNGQTDDGQNSTGASGGSSYSTGNGNYQYSSNGYNGSYGAGSNSDNNGGHKKKGHGVLKALFAVLLAVIFGICAGAGAYGISRVYSDKDSENSKEQGSVADADNEEGDGVDESSDEAQENKADLKLMTGDEVHTAVTDVAEAVMPSIVSVYNTYTAQSQDFWGQVYSQEATSTGSGIIIANTGDELLIATNNHVIDSADSLEVQFIDETTAAANLKGTDSTDDLAVIAVSLDDIDDDTMDKIVVATLGSSDDLKIGEPVVAIGNALGYGQSVTTGVVSAVNRELTTEDGETGTFIQTDAAINPGNSGGALLDLNGYVVGINSNKIGGTTVEGMGYAIPMSKAEPIIERLASQDTKIAVDEADQGYLGIAGVSVTSQVSSAYNMPQGAYVAEIYDGTGAADSELQKGDIITAVNGSTVESMNDLKDELTYYEAGTEITLTVQRADGSGEYSEQEIKLTLSAADQMPSDEEAQEQEQQSSRSNGDQNNDEQPDEPAQGNEQAPAGDSSADVPQDQPQGGNRGGGFYQFPWGNFFR